MTGRLSLRGRRTRLLLGMLWCVGAIAAAAPAARAQDDQNGQGEVSAQQRSAAAEAYDRGTSAWLAGQYAQAAQWFETANRLAPSPAALVQAIRAHKEAGNIMRAASLSLWLKSKYADEHRAVRVADQILKEATPNYTKVEVKCDKECSITVDGKVQEYNEFFVDPGAVHSISAGFTYGDKSSKVKGEPGETKTLEFEAPPKPKELKPGMKGYVAPPAKPPWPGLPKWLAIVGIGLTVGAGALTTWSALDTKDAADNWKSWVAFAQNNDGSYDPGDCGVRPSLGYDPCAVVEQKYNHGKKLERRTNILIGVTAGVGALTAVTAIFLTNWSGASSEQAPVEGDQAPGGPADTDTQAKASKVHLTGSFAYQPGGGFAVLEGRF